MYYFQVKNITPTDDGISKRIAAQVDISSGENSPYPDISVYVKSELDWNATLAESTQAAIDEAKAMLRNVANS